MTKPQGFRWGTAHGLIVMKRNIPTVLPPANSTLFSEIEWQLEIGSEQRSWTCFVSLSVHFQHPWTEQWLWSPGWANFGRVTGDFRDSLLLVSFFLYVSRAFKTSSLTVGWTAWGPTREVPSGPIVDMLDHLGKRRESFVIAPEHVTDPHVPSSLNNWKYD
jgi:hypothetical protein